MSEQESAQLRPAFLGGLVQRCESPAVGRVHRRVVANEERRDVQVAVRRRVVQGNQPSLKWLAKIRLEATNLRREGCNASSLLR